MDTSAMASKGVKGGASGISALTATILLRINHFATRLEPPCFIFAGDVRVVGAGGNKGLAREKNWLIGLGNEM